MGFKFNLQSVLEHRRHLEELAQSELAIRLKAENDCRKQIQWLGEEIRRTRRSLAEREAHGVPSGEFIMAGDYVSAIRVQMRREEMRLIGLKEDTARARGRVVEATRNRKAMDVLRERALMHYLAEERRQEQIFLDEVAVRNYLTRRM